MFYRGSDAAIIGQARNEEEAEKLMRVTAEEGINKGIIFDVQDVPDKLNSENLGGEYNYPEIAPEDDPGKTHIQVANAAIRGDYVGNPAIDPVEKAKLDEMSDEVIQDVVHYNEPPEAVSGGESEPEAAGEEREQGVQAPDDGGENGDEKLPRTHAELDDLGEEHGVEFAEGASVAEKQEALRAAGY